MAHWEVDVGAEPVNLKVAPTSLQQGRVYTIEVTGEADVRYASAAAAPSNRSQGHRLFINDRLTQRVGTDPLWFWTEGLQSHIAVSDVP